MWQNIKAALWLAGMTLGFWLTVYEVNKQACSAALEEREEAKHLVDTLKEEGKL